MRLPRSLAVEHQGLLVDDGEDDDDQGGQLGVLGEARAAMTFVGVTDSDWFEHLRFAL